jgi:hypothetical protein
MRNLGKTKSIMTTNDVVLSLIPTCLCFRRRMTVELRQLIKQRNKLQAQIFNGNTSADTEKKFKKMRNRISKHTKTLKGT